MTFDKNQQLDVIFLRVVNNLGPTGIFLQVDGIYIYIHILICTHIYHIQPRAYCLIHETRTQ